MALRITCIVPDGNDPDRTAENNLLSYPLPPAASDLQSELSLKPALRKEQDDS